MDNPCKECITYAICRNLMLGYLKDNDPRSTALGLMQELDKRCSLLTLYIRQETKKSKEEDPAYRLLPVLHKIAKETFL